MHVISVCMHVSVEECVHSSSGYCVFQYFALVWHAEVIPGKNLHKERYIGET